MEEDGQVGHPSWGGTDCPRDQEKVSNLWVLINPAGHTAFLVY